MTLEKVPVVHAQMLIRKPVAEVFEAFVDPAITTKFWFTKSSGRVEAGKEIQWEWEMYGASAKVSVKDVEPNERILIEWDDPPTRVEWVFTSRDDGTTLVSITNSGFTGSDDELVAQAIDSKGGFTSLLAALKAFSEHGIALNLVADQYPDAHVK